MEDRTIVAGFCLTLTLLSAVKGEMAAWPADFKFSPSGIPDGYSCIKIDEPKNYDHGWDDNYFCWKSEKDDPGFKWSHQGLIDGMRCTRIVEGSDIHWNNEADNDKNYICTPENSPYVLKWSMHQKTHSEWISFNEPRDPNTWGDNNIGADLNCTAVSAHMEEQNGVCTCMEGYEYINGVCRSLEGNSSSFHFTNNTSAMCHETQLYFTTAHNHHPVKIHPTLTHPYNTCCSMLHPNSAGGWLTCVHTTRV